MQKIELPKIVKIGNKQVEVKVLIEVQNNLTYVWANYDNFSGLDTVEVEGSLEFVKQYCEENNIIFNAIKDLKINMNYEYNKLKDLYN